MVTAEIAISLPILLVVAMIGAMAVMVAQARVRCADAATQAARAIARGDSQAEALAIARAAAGGPVEITVSAAADVTYVTAHTHLASGRWVPAIQLTERAAVAAEPPSGSVP